MRSSSFLIIIIVLAIITSIPAHGGQSIGPGIIEHGPRDSKKVALTFDACPTSKDDEYDERVIEVLIREKVPATLFMSGRWVEKNEDRAKFLAGQPQFEIANHAFWHPHMLEKDDERIVRELKRTQAIIKKITGKRPKYFRPPFGEVDERLAKLASQAGLVTVQYDIASGDPDPGLSIKKICRSVVQGVKGGSIVVFHMNENGLRTAEALPEIIKFLREKGFKLVTVGEMLNMKSQSRQAGREIQRKAEQKEVQGEMSSSTPSIRPGSAPSLVSEGTDTIVDTAPTGTGQIQPGLQ
jgi:peptidoglycan/xylan/chitin deacetylase (PgdA/CDA1 family)